MKYLNFSLLKKIWEKKISIGKKIKIKYLKISFAGLNLFLEYSPTIPRLLNGNEIFSHINVENIIDAIIEIAK